jgi:hypothetical protein
MNSSKAALPVFVPAAGTNDRVADLPRVLNHSLQRRGRAPGRARGTAAIARVSIAIVEHDRQDRYTENRDLGICQRRHIVHRQG